MSLGQCPAGYSHSAGDPPGTCYPQTEWLTGDVRYYPGIYGPEGGAGGGVAAGGAEGIRPDVAAAIRAAGHTIECRPQEDWMPGPGVGPAPIWCSIDGGVINRQAYAINYGAGALLVELGAKVPIFGATAPAPAKAAAAAVSGVTDADKVLTAARAAGMPMPATADEWCYFYNAALGRACPAPEDFGFTGAARNYKVDFATFWTRLTGHAPMAGTSPLPVTGPATTMPGGHVPGPTEGAGLTLTAATDFLQRPLFDGVKIWMVGAAAAGLWLFTRGRR